ncbi:MAG: trigger factor [Patescibacteria group bacterium]
MNTTKSIYTIVKQETLPDAVVSIELEFSHEGLLPFRAKALKKMTEHAELPGFRKGKVPEAVLIKKIGEIGLLTEAVEMAVEETIGAILLETKVKPLVRPEMIVTKIAEGMPVSLTLKIEVVPEVTLPDYKSLAKKENTKPKEIGAVTEKEIDEVIAYIRKEYAHREMHKHDAGEAPNHDHGEIAEADLPVFDDAFVKTVGEFKDVADFKNKVKENLTKEKEMKAKEKNRLAIIDAIVSKSDMVIPKTLTENELNKMESQFKHDVEKMGVKVDDYLKHIKKTIADQRADWKKDAEKRVKIDLILHTIADTEKIVLNQTQVEAEVEALLKHYPGADRVRTKAYVESMLANSKVFELLESIA